MNKLPTPETDDLDRELHNPRVLQDRYSEMMEHAQNMERERDEALNKMADALQEVDLRTLDFERMKQERDEAVESIMIILEENRHLADGDDCTLAKL